MKNNSKKNKFNIIVNIIIGLVIIGFIILVKKYDDKSIEILKILTMPLTTLFIAYFITNKFNYSSQKEQEHRMNAFRMDDSSGWRKQVFEVASTYDINLETVCKLRACLGTVKTIDYNTKNRELERVRNTIRCYCDDLMIKGEKSSINKQLIRSMARFLLKEHWLHFEYKQYLPKEDITNQQNKEYKDAIFECINLYEKELKREHYQSK